MLDILAYTPNARVNSIIWGTICNNFLHSARWSNLPEVTWLITGIPPRIVLDPAFPVRAACLTNHNSADVTVLDQQCHHVLSLAGCAVVRPSLSPPRTQGAWGKPGYSGDAPPSEMRQPSWVSPWYISPSSRPHLWCSQKMVIDCRTGGRRLL